MDASLTPQGPELHVALDIDLKLANQMPEDALKSVVATQETVVVLG